MNRYPPRGQSADERLRWYGWRVTSSGCWEWLGGRDRYGYGKVGCYGKIFLAHRLAYLAWIGLIPNGMSIRHSCDNPPCINPEHLIIGTNADNVRDRVTRHRSHSKLSEDDVVAIRKTYAVGDITLKKLAEQYNVSFQLIGLVVNRKNWRHI